MSTMTKKEMMEQMKRMEEMMMQMSATVESKIEEAVKAERAKIAQEKNNIGANWKKNFNVKTPDNSVMENRVEPNREEFNRPEFTAREKIALLRNEMYESCYEEIEEILEDKDTEMIEEYLKLTLIQKGQYDQELDNLSSMDREELIKSIKEIALQDIIERNKIYNAKRAIQDNPPVDWRASNQQLATLSKFGFDISKVVTSFYASKMITHFISIQDNTPTRKQLELISRFCKDLGIQFESLEIKDKKSASAKIEELRGLISESPCTDNQFATYKRYLEMNKIKKTDEELKELRDNLTKDECSKLITELKEKYNEENPYCTKGQQEYILSLMSQLCLYEFDYKANGQEYKVTQDSVKTLDRFVGTLVIKELQVQLCFLKCRYNCTGHRIEDLRTMPSEELSNLLNDLTKPIGGR